MAKKVKKFTVPVSFEFNGVFSVKADNLLDAYNKVRESCGMTLGLDNIHSSLPDTDIDWSFDTHPIKIIG